MVFLKVMGEHLAHHAEIFVKNEFAIALVGNACGFLAAVLQCKKRIEEPFGHVKVFIGGNSHDTAVVPEAQTG